MNLAALIKALFVLCWFLIKLTLDIVALLFLLPALLLPWRLPFALASACQAIGDHGDWISACFLQFFCAVLDCIAVPLGLVPFAALT